MEKHTSIHSPGGVQDCNAINGSISWIIAMKWSGQFPIHAERLMTSMSYTLCPIVQVRSWQLLGVM